MCGGYALLKEPTFISAYDIIVIMEGGVCIPESLITAVTDIQNGYNSFLLLVEYIETYLRFMTLDKLADKSINEWHRSSIDAIGLQIVST